MISASVLGTDRSKKGLYAPILVCAKDVDKNNVNKIRKELACVDTGSTVSAVSLDVVNNLGAKVVQAPCLLDTADTKVNIPTLGYVSVISRFACY